VHCTTQPELSEFRGVSDVGFSFCAVPTYYMMSEYFMLESGAQTLEVSPEEIALSPSIKQNWSLNFGVHHPEIEHNFNQIGARSLGLKIEFWSMSSRV